MQATEKISADDKYLVGDSEEEEQERCEDALPRKSGVEATRTRLSDPFNDQIMPLSRFSSFSSTMPVVTERPSKHRWSLKEWRTDRDSLQMRPRRSITRSSMFQSIRTLGSTRSKDSMSELAAALSQTSTSEHCQMAVAHECPVYGANKRFSTASLTTRFQEARSFVSRPLSLNKALPPCPLIEQPISTDASHDSRWWQRQSLSKLKDAESFSIAQNKILKEGKKKSIFAGRRARRMFGKLGISL